MEEEGEVYEVLSEEGQEGFLSDDNEMMVDEEQDLGGEDEDEDERLGEVDEEVASHIIAMHEQPVHSLCLFQGGIISGSEDDTLRMLDANLADSQLIKQHGDTVIAVKVSTDGQLLAAASMDGTVSIYDAQMQPVTVIEGPQECSWIDWHPSKAHFLAIGTAEGGLWVVEAAKNRCMAVMMGTGRPLRVGQWTPDGRLLVSGDEGGRVTVWSAKQAAAILVYDHPQAVEVCSLACLPTGDLLLAGYASGELRLLHTQHTMAMPIATLSGPIELIVIAEAAPFAIIASLAGELLVLDLQLMKPRGEVLKAPAGLISHAWLSSEYLALGSCEGHLLTLHPRTMQQVTIDLNHGVPCLSLLTDQERQLLWTGWDDGRLIAVNYGELLRE